MRAPTERCELYIHVCDVISSNQSLSQKIYPKEYNVKLQTCKRCNCKAFLACFLAQKGLALATLCIRLFNEMFAFILHVLHLSITQSVSLAANSVARTPAYEGLPEPYPLVGVHGLHARVQCLVHLPNRS